MKILLLIAFFTGVSFCQGQEAQSIRTYYVKGDISPTAFYGTLVNQIDSADYIRTVSREKNNENLYDVNEYYLDKKIKRLGNSITNGFAPKFNGNVISYYKNGNKAAEQLYVKGTLNGVSKYYFSNGQLKERVEIINAQGKYSETVLELNDSLGNHFLDEVGTGSFSVKDEKHQLVEGYYLRGKKDKKWKTMNAKSGEIYFDEYNAGEYVKGETLDADGQTFTYDKLTTLPEFNGGLKSFGSYLSRNLRYPPVARDYNIQGKVFLQFVIEKDGSLTEAKVIRGIGGGCDEEALRVINKSPKWNPGMQRGKAVRVSYTLPIFFQLSQGSSKKSTRKPFGGYTPPKN